MPTTSIIRRNQDPNFHAPRIDISFDRARHTITIADNGAGMTEQELHQNLATIGERFTHLQRQELRGKDAREAALLSSQTRGQHSVHLAQGGIGQGHEYRAPDAAGVRQCDEVGCVGEKIRK
uniref:Molecular chaperone HtpG n=1 Tax=Candidatus Kentrum sp. MB TaxID=2138164 RepID=A0A450X529_9GAMM|nr:MAG: hypothetical protein BECKMB1821G_GA0114241_100834 [Candidatus Kentron sp. MB]VFK30662.1 MAG: hypothetical protein BECKMB1821I_GA0114274_101710 [Candidatus Kentron sp. MB]VFK75357.1 MAG: hypothetical protein BECKMB1821H_GA0114242_102032 [Candidatus Kentron sp. MB]